AAARGNTVRVWDLADGGELCRLRGHTQGVSALAFGPDGDSLVSSAADQTVRVWDLTVPPEPRTLPAPLHILGSNVAFDAGTRLAGVTTAASPEDRDAHVWDWATGQVILTVRGHADTVRGLTFSPDGRHLATASVDKTIKVWDVATGLEVCTLLGHTGAVT